MRCLKCNVDLGEEYKKCPLCGETASDDSPTIEGLRTSDYPDIKYKNSPPSYFLMYVITYIGVVAAALVADLAINSTTANAMWAVFGLPCVWALIFRPICIRKLYFGSYIIHDVCYLSFLMLWYSKTHLEGFAAATYFGIPLICLIAELILVLGFLIYTDKKVNAATHMIAIGVANIVLLVVNAVGGLNCIPCACAIALSCITLIFLAIKQPDKLKDELAARFSI